jgi:lysophospholipase L1-like esterase
MSESGWTALVNPLGTLYNPASLLLTVRAALEEGPLPLFFDEAMGEWRCWWANTAFRAPSREGCEEQVRGALSLLREGLLGADVLTLTLGTNVAYTVLPEGASSPVAVSNCQRQPDRLFSEWRLTTGEVAASLLELIRLVRGVNPRCRTVLTVSPYRYRKYGLHGNALSKAVLLTGVEAVQQAEPDVLYFPAYEIMVDELRDYQYYAPDGLHPAPEAIDIIWNRFQQLSTGSTPMG